MRFFYTLHLFFLLSFFSSMGPGPLIADELPESETAGISFRFSSGFGVLHGVAGEYVYSGGKLASDLQWDMKPLYFLDFKSSVILKDFVVIELRYRYGFGGESGGMSDFDWDWPVPGSNTLSRHDAVTLFYHEAEAAFSFNAITCCNWSIAAGFSYLLLALQIDGRNGYEMVDDVITGTFDGSVIRYTQIYQVVPFHVSLSFKPWKFLNLTGALAYTPLVFCESTDIHYLRDIQYDDSISFGHYLNGVLTVDWSFSRYLALSLKGGVRWIPPTRGDSASYVFSTGAILSKSENTVGVSLLQVALTINAVFKTDW